MAKDKNSDNKKLVLIGGLSIIFVLGSCLTVFIYWKGVNYEQRGTFGDMFGSVNAVFSGLAFAGIILTIFMQKKELEYQREELRDTRKEFSIQNQTMKLQRFENTFFQMINLHHDIVDKIGKKTMDSMADRLYEFMRHPNDIPLSTATPIDPPTAWNYLIASYQRFYFTEGYETYLSNYYRNLYHIFKFIYLTDQIGEEKKKFYSSLVRSQLGQKELFLIFYNSMIPNLGNPKFLFLLKNFEIMENFNNSSVLVFEHHISFYETLMAVATDQLLMKEVNPHNPQDL
jgi:uncharacterized membrane protein